jgi:uncharacterized protein (DUF488 family)
LNRLYTIGYEGATLVDFLVTLEAARIDALVDIRELPSSRKQGFSKQALSRALSSAGIFYLHEKTLGTPKVMRDQVRSDKDYARFFRDYEALLQTRTAALEALLLLPARHVALMCFERDPHCCHRMIVARHLEMLSGVLPHHLAVGAPGNNALLF